MKQAALLAVFLAGALLPPTSLHAGEAPGRQTDLAFQIPAQRLDRALSRYSEVSGVDVLLNEADVMGRQSAPLTGRHTRTQALGILLTGTGLAARFTSRTSAIIRKPGAAERDAGAETASARKGSPLIALDMMRVTAPRLIGGARRDDTQFIARMSVRMRQIITAAGLLKRDENTRIRLQMRIRADGTLHDVRVALPSTATVRDRQVAALLDGAALDMIPPAGLRQPLLFDVDGR